MSESDEIRGAIAGQGGLLDTLVLNRFRADNVPVNSVNQRAFERLERLEQAWRAQPELIRRTGSVASGLAHAMMRLDTLHQRFFAEQPAPGLGVPLSPEGD